MCRHYDQRASDDDAWEEDDPEAPQERDLADENGAETVTVPCPSCRCPVPDLVDRCPYCGDWIVQSSGQPARRSRWVILAALIALVTFLAWYVF